MKDCQATVFWEAARPLKGVRIGTVAVVVQAVKVVVGAGTGKQKMCDWSWWVNNPREVTSRWACLG